jgi:D-alanine-D-alanine ligase
MIHKKTRVLVLFGGRSPEHDVSIITGLQAMKALDPVRYDIIPLYIAPNGNWLTGDSLHERHTYIPNSTQLNNLTPVVPDIGSSQQPILISRPRSVWQKSKLIAYDVALLAFHGLVGEDGNLQGLLETANVPYSGMRTLASSLLMNKIATKRMLANRGIPLLPFHEIHRPKQGLLLTPLQLEMVLGHISFPCCIKPVNLGSSIGVTKVTNMQEVSDVLPGIFRYDDTAMLEPFVDNLVEYNVAVGWIDGEIRTSAIERPKRTSELLDFKAKYMSGHSKKGGGKTPEQSSEGMLSLTRDINPDMAHNLESNIRKWAIDIFRHVNGTGMPRLDFLCNGATEEIWFNEANPCPGSFGYFLWESAQKPILFSELLDSLIDEAITLHSRKQIPLDPTPKDARLFARK